MGANWSQSFVRSGMLLILITAGIGAKADSGEQQRIHQTLDAFHQAAATGDFETYVMLMTEDVVFLGTDGTERWQGQAFRDFARPRFAEGGVALCIAIEKHHFECRWRCSLV